MKIALATLIPCAAWWAAIVAITQSPGIHSTPGIWAMLVGIPGVVVAFGVAALFSYEINDNVAYFVMFLGNWAFWWGATQGFLFLRRKWSRQSAAKSRSNEDHLG